MKSITQLEAFGKKFHGACSIFMAPSQRPGTPRAACNVSRIELCVGGQGFWSKHSHMFSGVVKGCACLVVRVSHSWLRVVRLGVDPRLY